MKNLLAILVLCTACSTVSHDAVARRQDADAQAVIATAQRLFDAMAAGDQAALQDVLDPNAQIIAIRNGSARVRSGSEWMANVTGSKEVLRERMWNPRVEVGDDMAALWAPYDFHIGEKFSHCGVDAFHFIRDGERWRLLTVTFTVRTEGCVEPKRSS